MNHGIKSMIAMAALLVATVASAGDMRPFDQASFEKLQAGGKPVLIDVYADWCPTCKQQAPIVSALMAAPEFKDYTVLKVNYDTQKDVRRTLGVSQQSTFIVYRGKQEVARSTGDTAKESIAVMLRKGLT